MKTTHLIAFSAVATIAVAAAAAADARTLRLQTSTTSGDASFKYMTEVWAPRLAEMTDGSLEIELLPTKSVVPHRETPDAVSIGVLDGDMNSILYFAGKDPAFAIMGDLIAGYDTPEQVQTFCAHGGGKEMLQEIYDAHYPGRIHVIGCGPYTREALVSTVPIRGVADLEGRTIRAPEGLASEIFRRAGASPVAIPFSEVYTSLEKGIVDAADASAYVNNDATGMHRIAQYPIYPGIHSQAVNQFILNAGVWEELTPAEQTAVETWYAAAWSDLRRYTDLRDRELVARDRAEGEIEVIDWDQADRDAFRAIAAEAWEDVAAQNALATKALDTHKAFMSMIGLAEDD
ncbi:MAG: TRAP transporter substrate-binding protein [Pseudomonadota bacterium]